MSKGPLPSQLCLLSDLPSKPVGDKVRFLSCVDSYSSPTGVLTLEHHQPQPVNAGKVYALVDVNLVLGSLKAEQTRVGEWVNVIGYITAISPLTDEREPKHGDTKVHIQALVVWSAGPLDVNRYEKSASAVESGRSTAARAIELSDSLLQL